jgi:endogenous inhibitor of DNA gyrase (YacG/DUF329 family)
VIRFLTVSISRYSLYMEWKCPICRKPTDSQSSPDFPFCSERCRLLDLGNWASEKYVVSEPLMDESESETPRRDTRKPDAVDNDFEN